MAVVGATRQKLQRSEWALGRTREAFERHWEQFGGECPLTRLAKIQALPTVERHGITLYTVRCPGKKKPHDYNVPEALLWALLSIDAFVCPFCKRNGVCPATPPAG